MMTVNIWDFLILIFAGPLLCATFFIFDRIDKVRSGKAARNEKKKITATWLNGLSLAFVVASVVTGFLSADLFAPIVVDTIPALNRALAAWLGFTIGVALHLQARSLLRRIED